MRWSIASFVRDAFWVIALGVVLAYAFFVLLGAIDVTEVVWPSIVIGVLALLWAIKAWVDSRRGDDNRDPRLVHARERRGF
jgi:hypothetical protein